MICKVKECVNKADVTWALVPVCEAHKQKIIEEQRRYYSKRINEGDRTTLNTIKHLIPWSNR